MQSCHCHSREMQLSFRCRSWSLAFLPLLTLDSCYLPFPTLRNPLYRLVFDSFPMTSSSRTFVIQRSVSLEHLHFLCLFFFLNEPLDQFFSDWTITGKTYWPQEFVRWAKRFLRRSFLRSHLELSADPFLVMSLSFSLTAGLGAGMMEAIFAVTPSETIKWVGEWEISISDSIPLTSFLCSPQSCFLEGPSSSTMQLKPNQSIPEVWFLALQPLSKKREFEESIEVSFQSWCVKEQTLQFDSVPIPLSRI